MKQTVDALNAFFEGFGIPAWPENGVPVGEKPPYITVQLAEPAWDAAMPFYARVWFRGVTMDAIMAKVDEIGAAIGEGVSLPTPTGCVWIHKGDSFAQRQSLAGDPTLLCVYLNMTIQALTE